MTHLRPFRAFRPQQKWVEKVVINPNNLMNEAERKEAARKNPFSIAHVVKPRIDFPFISDNRDPKLFIHARKYFEKLVRDKVLVEEKTPCYYVYRLTKGRHSQTGLVGCALLEDYLQGKIKKHEHVRPEKVRENVLHHEQTRLYSNPVFLAYKKVREIDKAIGEAINNRKPEYQFRTEDGVKHALWIIDREKKIEELTELFEALVPKTYIADGHHRIASQAELSHKLKSDDPYNSENELYKYFLTCLFPADQLKIYDYSRTVKDLNRLSEKEFLARVKKNFEIKKISRLYYHPSKLHEIGMYLGNSWYALSPKKNSYTHDPVGILDVHILQRNLLNPVLGIADPSTDKRIDFVPGTKGLVVLEKRVNKGKAAVAFALHPCSMEQLFAVADFGEVMPPKSTWFEPKLLAGLVSFEI